jgi:DNA mismatch repair protein MSH2
LETRKDGTKFTNRALKDAAERQQDISARYEQLQKNLVTQVQYVLLPLLLLLCQLIM